MKRVRLLILLLVAQVIIVLSPFRCLYAIARGDYNRVLEILKGYDRLGNSAFNGDSKETISSRADRARSNKRTWGCVLCKILDSIDTNHCINSKDV